MSTSTFIVFLAILFVGVPASLRVTGLKVRVRNPVALTMVATWLAGQAVYFATGESMPIKAMVLFDSAVISAMFVKDDWISCPYDNWRHQLACLWHERTPWDKGILALFPLAWLFYTPLVGGDFQYWTLWGIGLVQLALAGQEALHHWQRARGHAPRVDARGDDPPRSLFAPALGEAHG